MRWAVFLNTLDPARKNTLITSILTCVGYAYFNIGDAAMKLVGMTFHVSQIMVFNCITIAAFICGYGLITEGKKSFRIINKKWVAVRAILATTVGVLNILALPHITLAMFYTLVFTSPFWVAVLSAVFLKEKLDARRIAVILGGFVVILFIFAPGSTPLNIYAVMVLVGAFCYSGSMVIMRHVGPKESRNSMVAAGALLGLIVSLPFLPGNFMMPTPYEWGLFLIMGVLGAIGLLCVAYAFQNTTAATSVAPYHYTQIVWGAMLGYLIFGEVPEAKILIAAALIIAGGLYLMFSEARRSPAGSTKVV